jgi:spore coat polysaccharide biosynthesis protein SpsF
MTNPQERAWRGLFGDAYTDRNVTVPDTRRDAFARIVKGLDIDSLLEVGCNRGHNLLTLGGLLKCRTVGIDLNEHALGIAASDGCDVVRASGAAIPFLPRSFDLILTCGVLIHVALEELAKVMKEIETATSRYVLCIEYYAPVETVVPYRGLRDALFKRDFGAHFRESCPRLSERDAGFLDAHEGFDRCNWWLFEAI